MKETIVVNGKTYPAKEIDFNFVCELEMNGIEFTEVGTRMLPAVRCYIAHCMGTNVEKAGDIINQHFINGGNFEEIIKVFGEKVETSGFFQALNKTEEQKTSKSNPKKKEQEVSE